MVYADVETQNEMYQQRLRASTDAGPVWQKVMTPE